MLTIKSLNYSEKSTAILKDLSLQVEDDAIVSILGPSGSGKTSVLRTIMGLVTPEKGQVSFDGQVLSDNGMLRVPPAQRPFSFLFQNFTLFPHLTVKQNILIGIKHLSRQERRQRLEHLTSLLHIEHLIGRQIHSLSGGEQQRVALARTLSLSPKLLLLDEPFSNLDRMSKFRMYHDVKALIRDQNMSAVLATHDQEEAFFFSERLVVLDGGRVMADDTPHKVYTDPGTEWLAHFTGDAHCLTADQITAHFAGPGPEGNGECRYLIRPEQIVIKPGASAPAVSISEISYYGFYTVFELVSESGLTLSAVLTGPHDFQTGQTVSLSLNSPPARLTE